MKKDLFKESLSRRDFLKLSGSYAAMSSLPLMTTLAGLSSGVANAATSDSSGYKALVCVFQHGGNDSFNMLAPYDSGEYDDYVNARGTLALSKTMQSGAYLESIADPNSGRNFGLHSYMPEMRDLYNTRNVAFLANTGCLVEPVTKAAYGDPATQLPIGLFSHNDQQQHWKTSTPGDRVNRIGWAGKMADILEPSGINGPGNASKFMNMSLLESNIFQTGMDVLPYVVGIGGATPLSIYAKTNGQGPKYKQIIDNLFLDHSRYNEMEATYAKTYKNAIELAVDFNDAIANISLGVTFPNTPLGDQLEMVAKIIAARSLFGTKRQTFYTNIGGWDLHSGLMANHPAKLAEFSQAMDAFYKATEELCVENDVTTFTASDFGRTISSNGNGSDHAWGGNHMVMGGAVRGGRVYGQYPQSLSLDNELDIGRGRLIPTTSVDEYFAELALWFGMTNTDLATVLPNLNIFHPSTTKYPLGFMGQGKDEPCACPV